MEKLFYTLFLIIIVHSCKNRNLDEKTYNVRTDIRFGNKYFSMYIGDDGTAYVTKGVSSFYTEAMKVESSEKSGIFKLDSVKRFFENLNRIKEHPVIGNNPAGAPRVEIYYNQKKVYDTYKWDETFWSIFRPIMTQLPKGFNPFRADDKPFK